jgi:hypothetical protein
MKGAYLPRHISLASVRPYLSLWKNLVPTVWIFMIIFIE